VTDEDGDDVEELVGVVVRERVPVAERVLQKARANIQSESTVTAAKVDKPQPSAPTENSAKASMQTRTTGTCSTANAACMAGAAH